MTQGVTWQPLDKVVIGSDGRAMLALSVVIIVLSLGCSLLVALAVVLATAWRTPVTVPTAQRILVLGKRLRPDGAIGLHYRARLQHAVTLWRQKPADGPTGEIVILGGLTTRDTETEAAIGAAWLRDQHIPAECIRLEDDSRHTLESLQLYRTQFTSATPPILVTSRFHLARSAMLANGLGIPHTLCAAEPTLPLTDLPRCVAEAALIHWYVTGSCFARLTGNRQIADRIS